MKCGFLTVTYAGQFYDGPAPILEQIRKARALGFEGCRLRRSARRVPARPVPAGPPGDQGRRRGRGHRDLRRREPVELRQPADGRAREQPRDDAAGDRSRRRSRTSSSRSSPPGRGSSTTKTRRRSMRRTTRATTTSRSIPPTCARGGGRCPGCASRRTTPRSAASGWRCRITRRCCGPATRTRWR